MKRKICLQSTSKPDWANNCLMLSILLLSSVILKWYFPFISVLISGYVQSKSRAVHTMTRWFPDAEWVPVFGGLADHPDFVRYRDMVLAENTAAP